MATKNVLARTEMTRRSEYQRVWMGDRLRMGLPRVDGPNEST